MRAMYIMYLVLGLLAIRGLMHVQDEGYECVSPKDAEDYPFMSPAEKQAYEARTKPICDRFIAKTKAIDKVMHAVAQ